MFFNREQPFCYPQPSVEKLWVVCLYTLLKIDMNRWILCIKLSTAVEYVKKLSNFFCENNIVLKVNSKFGMMKNSLTVVYLLN